MVSYFGDFAEDDTVLIPFNTFTSDDPSASVTISNLADADIMVHKDGGTTQIATDGATVAIDYDGITGNHLITIDTSAHADYATGSEYAVRIEGTTVDGATINAWVGAFSIERAGGALALLKLIQAAVITNAAGADVAADIIAVKAETATIVADTNELQTDDIPGALSTHDGKLDTVDGIVDNILADTNELQTDDIPGVIGALNDVSTADVNAQCDAAIETYHLDHLLAATYDPASKPGAADALLNELIENDGGVSRYSANALEQASGSGATAEQVRTEMDANSTQLAAIVADTNELQTDNIPGTLSTIDGKIDTMDTNVDQIETAVITNAAGVDVAADIIAIKAETAAIVADTNELQTDDIPGALATHDGKLDTVDGIVDNILVDTGTTLDGKIDTIDGIVDSILADTDDIGVAGAGLTAVPWNASWDAEVQSECTDALNAYDPPTRAELTSDISGLNDLSAADVNAQVLDVLGTDTFAEPGQGAPPATTTPLLKLAYLYKFLRNKIETTSTEIKVYNDAGDTVDQKSTHSDDATTYTRGEFGTGA